MFCPSCGKELPDASSFCNHCGKPTAATQGAAPATAQKKSGVPPLQLIGIVILFCLVVMGGIRVLTSPSVSTPAPTPPAPAPVFVPMSTKLFTGQMVVKAGGYVTNKFTVQAGMLNFRVSGQFNASGGTGNDIQVVLADEDEFENWRNGHQAKVFYSTEKITTGKLDVGALPPGRYVLALSNMFSTFTDKYVFAEIEAHWTVQR
jgi:hypothetical protein